MGAERGETAFFGALSCARRYVRSTSAASRRESRACQTLSLSSFIVPASKDCFKCKNQNACPKCLPPSCYSFPRNRTYRRTSSAICFWGLKMRFFCLPKIVLFFASIFSRQNRENQWFWPPKTLPKPFQNPFKIDVPKNMRFFIEFCSKNALLQKCQHQKNMRPRSVLLGFHTFQCFAFGMHFRSKKPTKNPSKTRPEPFKNRC